MLLCILLNVSFSMQICTDHFRSINAQTVNMYGTLCWQADSKKVKILGSWRMRVDCLSCAITWSPSWRCGSWTPRSPALLRSVGAYLLVDQAELDKKQPFPIRIKNGWNPDLAKKEIKDISCFVQLDVFSGELLASPRALKSFMETSEL